MTLGQTRVPGVARFTKARLSRAWYLIFAAWLALLLLPDEPSWSKLMMLRPHGKSGTERYRREKHISQLAERDPLTALYNRRALEVRAPRLLDAASPARPDALLLIDIDNFKLVNDLHGHTAGDRLLVALGEMIRSAPPDGALTARLGGDEFAILLGSASNERILELGSALRDRFHQAASQDFATPEAVTLSIGATLFDHPPSSLAALIEQGDTALYASKRGGRDSIRLLDQTLASAEPQRVR